VDICVCVGLLITGYCMYEEIQRFLFTGVYCMFLSNLKFFV
jgi:hypothetical protein